MTTVLEDIPGYRPSEPAAPSSLTTEDYTRKIHWWVRLVGVVWLTSIALGIVGVIIIAIASSNVHDAFGDANTSISGSYSTYSACMADPDTTTSECLRLR